jgi:SNF2 family DNA or RNA helicase
MEVAPMVDASQQFTSVIAPLSEATRSIFSPLRLNASDRLRIGLSSEDPRYFIMQLVAPDGSPAHWYSTSDAARRTFWLRLPERKEHGAFTWRVAATDFTSLVTASSWPGDRISFESEDARLVHEYNLARFVHQSFRALIPARWRAEKVVPDHLHPDAMRAESPLSDCQRTALASLMGSEGYGLFMEQGTGKTAVVIARVNVDSAKLDRPMRVLVVCPKSVRTNWGEEFKKFATVPGAFAVLRGGAIKRVETLIDLVREARGTRWMAAIVSYEGVLRSWDAISMMEWDLVVLDESHYIKSPRTKRTRHIITKLREIATHRMALTGTPICNSYMDLWAQLEWLYPGGSGFVDFMRFRAYYGRFKKATMRAEKLVDMRNLPLIQERLARVAFQASKAEAVPGLPEKLYDVYEVEMLPQQAAAYDALCAQLIAEIEQDMADMEAGTRRVTVTNVLTKLLRLAQITSGFVKCDDMLLDDDTVLQGEHLYFTPNPKTQAILELASSLDHDEKMLVWATFVSDIKEVERALKAAGISCVTYYGATSEADREDVVRAFNRDPACKVLVGNPAAGGVGLNLRGYDPDSGEPDHGCSCTRVVYFSQNWSHPQRAQSEDRAHRRGTRRPVLYTDLVVPGTIDEEIRARVMGKRLAALQVQDIREILGALRESSVAKERDEEDDE